MSEDEKPAATSRRGIPVLQPSLPPLEDYVNLLDEIWDSRILANNGPMVDRLERELGDYLGVPEVVVLSSGTAALILALRALGVRGEVITSPYSFIASAHAVTWSGATPVFVDIDVDTYNIDPGSIEAAITPRTSAILPIHCYGNPCDVAAIDAIAERHGLKVIYDAAHAFGVEDAGGSLLRHGHASILSFHATKVFHTFEGGAIISADKAFLQDIRRLRNFGIVQEQPVTLPGINGKLSEVHAAMGVLQLRYVDREIARRTAVVDRYRELLAGVPGIHPGFATRAARLNHTYFPIRVTAEYGCSRDELLARLRNHGIHARRYFYPLLCEHPVYGGPRHDVAERLPRGYMAAEGVICLPVHGRLELPEVEVIAELIRAGSQP